MKKCNAPHWLAAQWCLWQLDQRYGRLFARGFRRWTHCSDGRVRPVRGEGWGSYWQWGDLRLTDWGCWLADDGDAWCWWAEVDRFYLVDRWVESPLELLALAPSPIQGSLEAFEVAALASEGRVADRSARWDEVALLQNSQLISDEAARAWYVQIGSRLLPESLSWKDQR